jgi:hypothetical protein
MDQMTVTQLMFEILQGIGCGVKQCKRLGVRAFGQRVLRLPQHLNPASRQHVDH